MLREVTCQCGYQCRGTIDEVVAQVQAHGREAHGIDSSREEILALAYPAEQQAGGPRPEGPPAHDT